MAYHAQMQSEQSVVDSALLFVYSRSKCLQQLTNWIAIVTALVINSMLLYIMFNTIYVPDATFDEALLITGLSFDLLAFMFLVVGCSIQMRLKTYFPEFYEENKVMLWFATISLCVCSLIRGLLDTSRYFFP